MGKTVLVLMGSPRKGGNSDRLSDEFMRGAREAGHEAEKIYLKDKVIGACLGCLACQGTGGRCVQNDDMDELYEKIKAADSVALASPVYFYTWNALMKTALDRTVAIVADMTDKTFYLIGVGQAPSERYMATMIDCFRKYVGCFRAGDSREGGYVFGYGVDKPGEVEGTPAMGLAYEMGKSV
ncbi:MAG: flavodoxin family protein [Deltaproteobacteria bacterium]|jgi:multimeric flavodoxin WrbA|nr:flavodoxin family protein [Deltaproteobacteria bacterium]